MSMDLEWLVCAPQKKFNISRHWTEDTFALYMLMERTNFSLYHQHTGLVWVCAPVGQWSIPPSRSQWLNTSKSAWGSKHGMPSCLHDLFLYYRFLILGPCVFYDHALAWATLGWTLTLYFLYLLYLFAWLLLSCNTFGLLLPTRFSSSVPQVSSLQYVISTNYYLSPSEEHGKHTGEHCKAGDLVKTSFINFHALNVQNWERHFHALNVQN